MAISVLSVTGAQAQAGAATTVSTPSLAFNGLGCNAIIIGIAAGVDSGTPSLTDSSGNTYTKIGSYNHVGVQATDLWAVLNPTTALHMVFTYTTTINTFPSIGVIGLTGLLSTTVDQTSGTTATTPLQPGSITPSQNNEIWISLAMDVTGNNGTTPTCNIGTMAFAAGTITAQCYGIGLSYGIQTTASAVNPQWTFPSETLCIAGIYSLESIPLLPLLVDFQEVLIRGKINVVNY